MYTSIREVMSSPAVTVHASTAVGEAVRIMTSRKISALPVVDDDDQLVGIISDADLLANRFDTNPNIRHRHRPGPHDQVADLMTTAVVSLTPSASIGETAILMVDENIRCVPVVDGRHVLGVVTRADLLNRA